MISSATKIIIYKKITYTAITAEIIKFPLVVYYFSITKNLALDKSKLKVIHSESAFESAFRNFAATL